MQYVILTASGVVGPASAPGIVYGCVLTCGATAGTLTLKNGGTGGSTIMVLNVAANDTVQFKFDKPLRFTTDIYATIVNLSYSYINFEFNKGVR
jgi:hypothetical protein